MPTAYPLGLDDFTNPTPADDLNTPAVLHSDEHSNANDAIEALESWVGISGTSVQASHEFRIVQLEIAPPNQSSVVVWDEGSFVGTGTIINFVGANVDTSISGTVIRVFITGSSGGLLPVFPQEVIGIYGQDEGTPLGTGTILNVVGDNIDISLSGTVLRILHTNPTITFPQEVIGVYGQNQGVPLGTGSIFNVNGSRLIFSISGTSLELSNSPDPIEIIGIVGQDEGTLLGTGTTLNVVGSNIAMSLSGTVLNITHADTPVTFPQEVIGVMAWDEGQPLGTGTILNITGDGIVASLSGTVLQIQHSHPQNIDQIGILGQSKGVNLGTGTIFNVNGTRLVLSLSGTSLELSNSPEPVDNIGMFGSGLGTGTVLSISGPRLSMTLTGSSLNIISSPDAVELIGIYGLNNGIPLGTGTWLDFGNNTSTTISGTVLRVNVNNPSFPQSQIGIMGQDEGLLLGTGTTLNVVGNNIAMTLSGTVLNISHTDTPVTFPAELIGVMGQNKGIALGTGTTLNINGTRLVGTLSGTVLDLSNSPDPVELIGIFGQDEGINIGTGTILNVVGSRLSLSLSGTVLNLSSSPDPVDGIGVMLQNNGKNIGTGTTLDVMGSLTVSGSVTQLRVPKTVAFVVNGVPSGAFTNYAAIDTTYSAQMVDLVGYGQCKLGGVFGSTAPNTASGTIVHLMWATGSSYATLQELALNKDAEEGRLRWITSTQRSTPWFTIHTGSAVADVGVYLRVTGGNAVADPTLLGIFAEFR